MRSIFYFPVKLSLRYVYFPLFFPHTHTHTHTHIYIYIYISKNRRVAFVVVELQLHHLIITLIATQLFIFYSYFYDIYIYIYKDYRLYTFIMGGFNITLNFAFTYSSTLILNLFFILTHFILHHMDYYKRYMCLKNQLIKLQTQCSDS